MTRMRNLIATTFQLALAAAAVSLASTNAAGVPAEGHRMMVAGPSPYSVQIVKDIQARGGNVVDALVASAIELGVTHPYYASMGGGGFALVKMGKEIEALDFREMAPKSANPDTYKDKDQKASLVGGLAVGVPGIPAGLYELHKKYGKLKWALVVEPALKLAKDGFQVSGEWVGITKRSKDRFSDEGKAIFAPDLATGATGTKGATDAKDAKDPKDAKDAKSAHAYMAGDTLKQKALADYLRRYSKEGPKAFYQGATAKEIVDLVNKTGGAFTTEDLANYKVRWLKPMRTKFLGYDVSMMPPPSSGGVVIAQALKLVEKTGVLEKTQPLSVDEFHTLIEIEKMSYRNRAQLGDPDFSKIATDDLTSDAAIDKLAKMIKPDKATASATLLTAEEKAVIENAAKEKPQTTHMSVMDADGNTVAMTVTLNGDYGSGLVTKSGIALNNEMDDFTTHPGKPNMFGLIQGEANAVRAGARPLSSMSPTIVEKDGTTVLSLGAPGGPRIISAVFQVIYRVLGRNLDVDVAIQTPRVHHQFLPDQVKTDANKLPPETLAALKARGHSIDFSSTAKVYAVRRSAEGVLSAAADARGEGAAGGN